MRLDKGIVNRMCRNYPSLSFKQCQSNVQETTEATLSPLKQTDLSWKYEKSMNNWAIEFKFLKKLLFHASFVQVKYRQMALVGFDT